MREIHGVRAASDRIVLVEGVTTISLEAKGMSGVQLTPDEARHLARKLCRLARRIEAVQP